MKQKIGLSDENRGTFLASEKPFVFEIFFRFYHMSCDLGVRVKFENAISFMLADDCPAGVHDESVANRGQRLKETEVKPERSKTERNKGQTGEVKGSKYGGQTFSGPRDLI